MNIIILGCDKGLGYELALAFAREGCAVTAGCLRPQESKLHDVRNVSPVYCDVTDAASLTSLCHTVQKTAESVDCVINVAGILLPGDRVKELPQVDMADMRKTFDVNFFGVVNALTTLSGLVKQNGVFITITSESVDILQCGAWIPAYALSKTVATKAMGIMRVSDSSRRYYAMHPGRMDTDMGHSSAQITASASANSIVDMVVHNSLPNNAWYIDYTGKPMLGSA